MTETAAPLKARAAPVSGFVALDELDGRSNTYGLYCSITIADAEQLAQSIGAAVIDARARERKAKQDRRNAIYQQIAELQSEMQKLDAELAPPLALEDGYRPGDVIWVKSLPL